MGMSLWLQHSRYSCPGWDTSSCQLSVLRLCWCCQLPGAASSLIPVPFACGASLVFTEGSQGVTSHPPISESTLTEPARTQQQGTSEQRQIVQGAHPGRSSDLCWQHLQQVRESREQLRAVAAAAAVRCSHYHNEEEEIPALKLLLLSLLSLSGFICIHVFVAAHSRMLAAMQNGLSSASRKDHCAGCGSGVPEKLLTAGAVVWLLGNTSPGWPMHCRSGPEALVWVFRRY